MKKSVKVHDGRKIDKISNIIDFGKIWKKQGYGNIPVFDLVEGGVKRLLFFFMIVTL